MSLRRKDFHANIVELDTPLECVYNADQTGLYYQKLQNRVYVDEANKKDYSGVKQIKEKNRITIIMGTVGIW